MKNIILNVLMWIGAIIVAIGLGMEKVQNGVNLFGGFVFVWSFLFFVWSIQPKENNDGH